MSPVRASLALLLGCGLALSSGGCRSTSGAFQMDSNSRVPWFGMNFSLPTPSARRKTLQTISRTHAEEPTISLAEEHTVQPAPTQPRGLLSRLRGSDSAAIPAPPPSADELSGRTISLSGPREEFR